MWKRFCTLKDALNTQLEANCGDRVSNNVCGYVVFVVKSEN